MAPGCRTPFVPARPSGSFSAILYRPGEHWQADPRLFPAPSGQRPETYTVLLQSPGSLAFAVLIDWRCAFEGIGSSASRPAGLLSSKKSKGIPASLWGTQKTPRTDELQRKCDVGSIFPCLCKICILGILIRMSKRPLTTCCCDIALFIQKGLPDIGLSVLVG